MLEVEGLSFLRDNYTVSWRRGFAIRVYIRSKAYELQCMDVAHWYDEYVSRTIHNNQSPLGVKIIKVSRCMQIVLDVLYFMNCLPTNTQTNESLCPIQ